MKSQIYHAPLGEGINRAWVTLEKLTDDDSDDSGWEWIKRAAVGVGFVVFVMAVFAFLMCVLNPA